MRSKTYITKIKNEVEKWENAGPGYLSQISDFVFYPAQKAAELLVPDFVMDTVEASVKGCLEALLFGASYTISKDDVLQSLAKENSE
ncbi:MAG: hypothetical protein EOM73_16270, partial [Bacteroidia bacterium]|nr:hypothetical protein [Bacteroidia bacterium]